jgi:hypothetical protein
VYFLGVCVCRTEEWQFLHYCSGGMENCMSIHKPCAIAKYLYGSLPIITFRELKSCIIISFYLVYVTHSLSGRDTVAPWDPKA